MVIFLRCLIRIRYFLAALLYAVVAGHLSGLLSKFAKAQDLALHAGTPFNERVVYVAVALAGTNQLWLLVAIVVLELLVSLLVWNYLDHNAMDRYIRQWGRDPVEAYLFERELGASVPEALLEFFSQIPGVILGTAKAGLGLLPEVETEGEAAHGPSEQGSESDDSTDTRDE